MSIDLCVYIRTMQKLIVIALALAVPAAATVGSSEIVLNSGRVRVQALSPTLVRIEPKGPTGFEDRTSLMVVDRDFAATQLPISLTNQTAEGTWLSTSAYRVFVYNSSASGPPLAMVADLEGNTVWDSVSAAYPLFADVHRL